MAKPGTAQRLIYARALRLDQHREAAVIRHIYDQNADEQRRVREAEKAAEEREKKAAREARKAELGDKGRWVVKERGALGTPTRYQKETTCGAMLIIGRDGKGLWRAEINEVEVPLDVNLSTGNVEQIKDRLELEFTRRKARL